MQVPLFPRIPLAQQKAEPGFAVSRTLTLREWVAEKRGHNQHEGVRGLADMW